MEKECREILRRQAMKGNRENEFWERLRAHNLLCEVVDVRRNVM